MSQLIGFFGSAIFYSEGFSAQAAAFPREANPYVILYREDEAEAWFAGWDSAAAGTNETSEHQGR
jgi:hypothetical protein